nr:hypothetical protein BaRGS_019055 [Batillaria attramentaria]
MTGVQQHQQGAANKARQAEDQRQSVGKGSAPVMPAEMETAFSQKLRDLADKGFGLTKRLVQVKAAEFCEKTRIATPFRNHMAGQTWLAHRNGSP